MPTEQVVEMIELTYNIDIVEEVKGVLKVLKRNIPVKKLVSIYDIKNPTQVLSKNGTVLRNRCRILLKDEGEVVINKSYEQIKKLIMQETPKPQAQIGFKLKNHNKNVKSSRRNQANPE